MQPRQFGIAGQLPPRLRGMREGRNESILLDQGDQALVGR
jgi:hypothetical protein